MIRNTLSIGSIAMPVVVFLLLIQWTSEAKAIGDTERGILYGLGIYKLYDVVTAQEPWEPGKTYGNSDSFPPFRCRGDSVRCSYERGVYEREREIWEDDKQKAYECGRYGRNCEGGV